MRLALLTTLLLASTTAAADQSLSAFAVNDNVSYSSCTGDCAGLTVDRDMPVGFEYAGFSAFGPVDLGASLVVGQDQTVNLLARKSIGSVSLTIGAGYGSQTIDSEILGRDANRDRAAAFVYSAAIDYRIGAHGSLFVGYAYSEADHTLVGLKDAGGGLIVPAVVETTVTVKSARAGYRILF